jgi:hypothetical protein
MSRIKVLALAAVLALGSLSFATEASARGGHGSGGHFSGGHFNGGHWGGHFGGFGFHRGYGFRRGPGFYGYYPYAGCWRWHRVWTPYGWRLHRINVCYYPYY